jgi:F-type H+-transporting ATPase subunit b
MEKLLEEFSLGLFVWQTLLFVGLLLLLKKYAWGPILNAVNEREEGIKNALSAADDAKKEMENLQADNQKLLKEREAMLKEARELKNKMIDDAKEEAKEEAAKLVAQAQAAIETEKKAAIADLKAQVADLSISIAEKVLGEELSNKGKQEKLVESMLDDTSLN